MKSAFFQHPAEAADDSAQDENLKLWSEIIVPAIATLKGMAGTTEDEFLQIGSLLQGFYQRSSEITAMSSRLVEAVSGAQVQSIIARLRQTMADMEEYLHNAHGQRDDSHQTLERILELLGQVSHPLEGFQKMYKTLRMLSTSTKIESARLGELGAGFLHLALDVEKLSYQVNDKTGNILKQRQELAVMINENLQAIISSGTTRDANVVEILSSTANSLDDLVSANERCTRFGGLVSSISSEVSSNLSEVVASMQSHDITRQQVEHIVEALERLAADLQNFGNDSLDAGRRRNLVIEAGDVCELQSAQLRHASSELHKAVCSIVDNLRDVANQQMQMTSETLNVTGVDDSSGHSFVDGMSQGLSAVISELANCANNDREMTVTMNKVAGTIGEIAGFVTDIEEIGSEIDLIALNSQIKAAHTGREGAALGVLAEAIKRLSLDAVIQTEAVAHTLSRVNEVTEHLFVEVDQDKGDLLSQVTTLESDLKEILGTLGGMNADLSVLLSSLNERVSTLSEDIERATSGIDVHERSSAMAEKVIDSLDGIVDKARSLEPASTEFKENLRHMEERYTMESERHIHEAIARKRSGMPVALSSHTESIKTETGTVESEFGDNVDLF
ncbi:MAG: methyl-accepting chemotaxis protein [Geobacter sp.]|nr:MAG: methyl-accepting chemotaxis protein [Geobacter sp.]